MIIKEKINEITNELNEKVYGGVFCEEYENDIKVMIYCTISFSMEIPITLIYQATTRSVVNLILDRYEREIISNFIKE